MTSYVKEEGIRRRLMLEVGRIDKPHADFRVALAYPSPYRAAMSSLGFLQIYKAIQQEEGMSCERAFLGDDGADRDMPLTYEGLRPLAAFPVVALSVAYELELAGVVKLLDASKIPPLCDQRTEHDPLIVAGGPLTFSNPLPLAAFADVLVMGEGDTLAVEVLRVIRNATGRNHALDALAGLPHVFVPARHGAVLPTIAKCSDDLLPAYGPICTPEAELSGMFLIETERGCSRACTYCVMRRTTNGGMRLVPMERLLQIIPASAQRVGLVGAAVSDHPDIAEIVRTLAERGAEVGLSSLRPDRLSDELVGALKLGGYRTLTTAMDGTSERVRALIGRRTTARNLERAADLARAHGMSRMKLYLMVGLPGETDADIDECVELTSKLSRTIPIALGIAPFCPKRNTPLGDESFAGVALVQSRLARLRQGLRGRVDVRSTSARWAWVEATLAKGDMSTGRAVLEAVRAGGGFAAYTRAFGASGAKRTLRLATGASSLHGVRVDANAPDTR
jgi:hypothetical protein